jgi:hypothetical protein
VGSIEISAIKDLDGIISIIGQRLEELDESTLVLDLARVRVAIDRGCCLNYLQFRT